MGKVSYHFFLGVFGLCFDVLLLFNFLGWSGGFLNLGTFTSASSSNWTEGYFGFQSIQLMLHDFNGYTKSVGVFNISSLLSAFTELGNVLTFGIPRIISTWKTFIDGSWSWNEIINIVYHLFIIVAQPLLVLAYVLVIAYFLIMYAVGILTIFLSALAGNYNIHFTNPLNYSDIQSDYNAFSAWFKCGIIGHYLV